MLNEWEKEGATTYNPKQMSRFLVNSSESRRGGLGLFGS